MKKIELSDSDIKKLSDLKDIAIEDDVFDLRAYDSISRADKISNCWQALDVIDKIIGSS